MSGHAARGRWTMSGPALLGAALILLGAALLLDGAGLVELRVGPLVVAMVLLAVGAGSTRAGLALRDDADLVGLPAGELSAAGTAVFGDVRLTITELRPESRPRDRLRVPTTAVFGDVHVAVPAGWRVIDRTTTLFGDVRLPADQPSDPAAPVVELHGVAIFGNVRAHHLDAREGAHG